MVIIGTKIKALIETYNNNRIAQIEPDDRIFQVVPSLQWVDCPDCQTDWFCRNGEFTRPEHMDMTTAILQDTLSTQTRNRKAEIWSGQKNEFSFSCSNAVNTNAAPAPETIAVASWCDEFCIRCYELMDILRSDNVRILSQEEPLLMFSVLKWLREFAEGKTAN